MRVAEMRELYDYDAWANERLWQAVADLSEDQLHTDIGSGSGSILATLAHMVGGMATWRARWEGVAPTLPARPDDFSNLPPLRRRWDEEVAQLRHYLATLREDYHRPFAW